MKKRIVMIGLEVETELTAAELRRDFRRDTKARNSNGKYVLIAVKQVQVNVVKKEKR